MDDSPRGYYTGRGRGQLGWLARWEGEKKLVYREPQFRLISNLLNRKKPPPPSSTPRHPPPPLRYSSQTFRQRVKSVISVFLKQHVNSSLLGFYIRLLYPVSYIYHFYSFDRLSYILNVCRSSYIMNEIQLRVARKELPMCMRIFKTLQI